MLYGVNSRFIFFHNGIDEWVLENVRCPKMKPKLALFPIEKCRAIWESCLRKGSGYKEDFGFERRYRVEHFRFGIRVYDMFNGTPATSQSYEMPLSHLFSFLDSTYISRGMRDCILIHHQNIEIEYSILDQNKV